MTDWNDALAARAKECPVNASFVELYITALQDPTHLRQMDLFREAHPQLEHQQGLEEWWTNTMAWLVRNRDPILHNLGVYLQKQTKENEDSGAIKVFWQETTLRTFKY